MTDSAAALAFGLSEPAAAALAAIYADTAAALADGQGESTALAGGRVGSATLAAERTYSAAALTVGLTPVAVEMQWQVA